MHVEPRGVELSGDLGQCEMETPTATGPGKGEKGEEEQQLAAAHCEITVSRSAGFRGRAK